MSKYTKDDFKNMMFDVYPFSKDKDILALFPDLKKHSEFTEKIYAVDKDKLLTYIFLMYDKESPLVVNISNISLRKDEALLLAGFKQRYKKWSDDINKFKDLKNKDVNKIITKFFLIQHSNKFQLLISFEEAYSQMCEVLRTPISGDKVEEKLKNLKSKAAISKEASDMADEIDELRRTIFRKDEAVADLVEEEVNEQRIFAGIREQRAKLKAEQNGQA